MKPFPYSSFFPIKCIGNNKSSRIRVTFPNTPNNNFILLRVSDIENAKKTKSKPPATPKNDILSEFKAKTY